MADINVITKCYICINERGKWFMCNSVKNSSCKKKQAEYVCVSECGSERVRTFVWLGH